MSVTESANLLGTDNTYFHTDGNKMRNYSNMLYDFVNVNPFYLLHYV